MKIPGTKRIPLVYLTGTPQRFGFERVARVESLQIIDEMSEDAATVENFPSTPEPGSP
jgi:hypothetical protein